VTEENRSLAVATVLAIAAVSWVFVIRDSIAMQQTMAMSAMQSATASHYVALGVTWCLRWGIMMAAMMLPSALPMLLLYRTVRTRLADQRDVSIPTWAFVAIYLLIWLLFGVPVYAIQLAVTHAASTSPAFAAAIPYCIAATLVVAGAYQFTTLKRACLRACESPLSFLMRRWRSGYRATMMLALEHAAFCIGCCWALMVILVAAGAMSLPWVLAIALLVSAEKLLPARWRSRELAGVALVILGIAVALRPELAGTLRRQ
jgi:predicted metal-binding membrane protein